MRDFLKFIKYSTVALGKCFMRGVAIVIAVLLLFGTIMWLVHISPVWLCTAVGFVATCTFIGALMRDADYCGY